MLKEGIIASPGIAIAKAFVYDKVEVEVTEKRLTIQRLRLPAFRLPLKKARSRF